MAAMAESEPWTIHRLMDWTRPFLERKGVEEPRLAAEVLLAHALAVRKIELYTNYENVVPPESLTIFRDLVARAAAGEPIAYLVGYREFFSLKFKVTPDVLIPRPETETLVDAVIHAVRQRGQDPAGLRILDVATGSGCIAIVLARHLAGARVIATDISESALAVARENAESHKAAVEFRHGPFFEPLAGEPPFDYVCSNPPYIAENEWPTLPRTVRDYEPRSALAGGPEGLDVIGPLFAEAPSRLAEGGMLFVEVGYNQAGRVVQLAESVAGLSDIHTVRDNLGHERLVVASKA